MHGLLAPTAHIAPTARAISLLLATTLLSSPVCAQDAPRSQIRAFAGAMIPTGQQAHDFASAPLLGGTLATHTGTHTTTIASLSWAPTVSHFPGIGSRVQFVTWDIGLEVASVPHTSAARTVPFGGIGLGARSYEWADDTLTSPNLLSGYVAAGVELRRGRPALRFEVRDYISPFRRPSADKRSMRNDVMVSMGVAYGIRE